jgi:beta-lactamase regulating signal transducer with metallopeptidase domain
MLTWLAGIVVLSTWLLVRLTGLRREHITEGDALALPERFYTQLEAVAAKLDLKRLPRVILTDKVACPAVFGVLRPMLLMPAKKFATMSARDTEHVLLHELAHIKRGDLVVHAVWMLVQIVYWFNPLLWMIRRTLQNLRELCCDATVARLLRDKTCHYRETLLETARQLLAEPVDPGLGLLGLFENNNWLVTRLQWLEKNTWKNRPLRIVTIIALVAVMATCVLPMASGQKTAADAEAMAAKEISGQKVDKDFCLLLLDDCDPDFKGKDTYEDKLYLLDNEFKIKGSLSGLNICRNVGGNHALAVDEKRKTAWVAESVGDRLFHINLKTGMIIQVLGNIKASSVSIDPKTGNAWVLTSEGTIYGKELVVFNPKGKSIANYDIHGQDIVYSRKDDCFWVVGKTVLKVNKKGDVLGKIEGQIPWCAVSVDIDENNGNAWIVVRAHSQVEGSRDEIWIVNSNLPDNVQASQSFTALQKMMFLLLLTMQITLNMQKFLMTGQLKAELQIILGKAKNVLLLYRSRMQNSRDIRKPSCRKKNLRTLNSKLRTIKPRCPTASPSNCWACASIPAMANSGGRQMEKF